MVINGPKISVKAFPNIFKEKMGNFLQNYFLVPQKTKLWREILLDAFGQRNCSSYYSQKKSFYTNFR